MSVADDKMDGVEVISTLLSSSFISFVSVGNTRESIAIIANVVSKFLNFNKNFRNAFNSNQKIS
jgi:hypothetical protein